MEEILNTIACRLWDVEIIVGCIAVLCTIAEIREAFLTFIAVKMQRNNKEAIENAKQQREEDRDLFSELLMKNVHVVTFKKPEDVEESEEVGEDTEDTEK